MDTAGLENAFKDLRSELAVRDEKLRADLAERDAERDTAFERLRSDFAELGTEFARRENRIVLTLVGVFLGAGGLGVAFLGFLIGLPQ